jgi:hypothetical protein
MKTPALLTLLTAATAMADSSPSYTLHEWGTFTTLSTSEGKLLPGVQREEEPLPEFVQSHEGMMHHKSIYVQKGWMRPLAGVTVRMETPVIYFYTKDPFDVKVNVGFKGGSISQWFPSRSGGETPPKVLRDPKTGWPLQEQNTLDFAKGYQGGITWDVKVTPAGDDAAGRVFKRGETPSWIYPRNPDSALVSTKKGETEKYLFYRGVGNLTPPVTFSSSGDGRVTIENKGSGDAPGMLIYEMTPNGSARWSTLTSLKAGASQDVNLTPQPTQMDWRAPLYADAAAMLVRAGLYRKEADAMIQTWWPSYFEHQGLRVFWIVPYAYVDEVLPLNVTPAPATTVRVMVGRSEVLTPQFEKQLAADFSEAETSGKGNRWESDRYFPAYAARVEQLSKRTAGK